MGPQSALETWLFGTEQTLLTHKPLLLELFQHIDLGPRYRAGRSGSFLQSQRLDLVRLPGDIDAGTVQADGNHSLCLLPGGLGGLLVSVVAGFARDAGNTPV